MTTTAPAVATTPTPTPSGWNIKHNTTAPKVNLLKTLMDEELAKKLTVSSDDVISNSDKNNNNKNLTPSKGNRKGKGKGKGKALSQTNSEEQEEQQEEEINFYISNNNNNNGKSNNKKTTLSLSAFLANSDDNDDYDSNDYENDEFIQDETIIYPTYTNSADQEDFELQQALLLSQNEFHNNNNNNDNGSEFLSNEEKDDLLIAAELQRQYNQEYNEELNRSEKKFNIPGSKVLISMAKRRINSDFYLDEEEAQSYLNYFSDDDDDSESELLDSKIFGNISNTDFFDDEDEDGETLEKVTDKRPRNPVISGASEGHSNLARQNQKKIGLQSITKHDAKVCGVRNGRKIERFPPNFQSGNVGQKGDIKLSGAAFNALREFSKKNENSRLRHHEKQEHSTTESVMDSRTKMIVYRMVNNGTLREVHGVVSMGKESAVYHAFGGDGPTEDCPDATEMPPEVAIKIFKTTLNEFRNRSQYIEEDYRFKDKFSRQNPRKVIKLWAEKEMHNLQRLKHVNINCPEVALLRSHILLMTFIGEDGVPAPKLKEAHLGDLELQVCYTKIVDMMYKMYNQAQLVHADLSEYNILYFKNEPYIIDVSQAVDYMHPNSLVFLYRDCSNITRFFEQRGTPTVLTVRELFKFISDIEILGRDDMEFLTEYQLERSAFRAASEGAH